MSCTHKYTSFNSCYIDIIYIDILHEYRYYMYKKIYVPSFVGEISMWSLLVSWHVVAGPATGCTSGGHGVL